MSEKNDKRTSIITIIMVIICIPLVLSMAYRFRRELKIERQIMQIQNALSNENKYFINMDLVVNVNDKDLRIVFRIPCESMRMKKRILENMTVIRHEMLMSYAGPVNKQFAEERDFEKIKSNCLAVLNKYGPVDIENVYVEFFALN